METIDIIALVASFLFFLAGLLFFILTCYIIHKRAKRFRKYGYWRGWYGYGPNPYYGANPSCNPNGGPYGPNSNGNSNGNPYGGPYGPNGNPNGGPYGPNGNPYGCPEPPRDPDRKDVK